LILCFPTPDIFFKVSKALDKVLDFLIDTTHVTQGRVCLLGSGKLRLDKTQEAGIKNPRAMNSRFKTKRE
jgi:hypothetical protein